MCLCLRFVFEVEGIDTAKYYLDFTDFLQLGFKIPRSWSLKIRVAWERVVIVLIMEACHNFLLQNFITHNSVGIKLHT
jgi:hypothetical protein